MLAFISPTIARGVIDNTAEGLIDLRLWCSDELEPLHFRMPGNCLRDIAGCRVTFTNRAALPAKQTPDIITDLRNGRYKMAAGDITLSRRSQEKDNRGYVSNSLSIELFADTKIRILIETSSFDFDISLPQWRQSWEGDNMQQMVNMEALRSHVAANVRLYQGPGLAALGKEVPPCDWDYRLNEAEAYMAIYPSIHDKYQYEPGGYLSAAYVLNRLDFLGQEASEEEAHMPPDPDKLVHDWDVLDFLPKEHREAVHRAMRHPLFQSASKMTALAKQHLIDNRDKQTSRQTAVAFVNLFASIVTQLLATILLTQDEGFSVSLAKDRLRAIAGRLEMLSTSCSELASGIRQDLRNAAFAIGCKMSAFLSSLGNIDR